MVQKNFNKANECTDARLLAGVICLVPDKLYEKDKLDKVVHMGNQIAIHRPILMMGWHAFAKYINFCLLIIYIWRLGTSREQMHSIDILAWYKIKIMTQILFIERVKKKGPEGSLARCFYFFWSFWSTGYYFHISPVQCCFDIVYELTRETDSP